MTVRHQLKKLQHKRKRIEVVSSSLDDYLSGKRNDLDHIVMFNHQKQIITSRPTPGYPLENYLPVRNYIPERRYYHFKY